MDKKIMCIVPHPDDEVAFSGFLQNSIMNGDSVHIICVTNGEAGRAINKYFDDSISSEAIRILEMKNSCEKLGVSSLHFMNLKDGKSSEWHFENHEAMLVDLINNLCPDIIVTYNENGMNGHPDHIETSRFTTFVCNRYFSKIKLVYLSLFPKELLSSMLENVAGYDPIKAMLLKRFIVDDQYISHIHHLSKDEVSLKIDQMRCHKSRFPDERGNYYDMPFDIFKVIAAVETYYYPKP